MSHEARSNSATLPADTFAEADALRDAGKLDEALATYLHLVEQHPGSAEAHNKLGVVYNRLGRNELAEAAFRAALAVDAHHPYAAANLGLLLADQGRFAGAENHFWQALAENPNYFEAHINLGNALTKMNRQLEAAYLFRKAVALCPDLPLGHERLGQLLVYLGRSREGLAELRRSVELDPKFISGWNNIGFAHYWQGDYAEAEAAFAQTLALDPNFTAAWNNTLLLQNYRRADPQQAFEKALAFGRFARERCGPVDECFAQNFDPERRLRVGIVSSDLRTHSVSFFLKGAINLLDRRQVELVAYYNFFREDDVTQEFRELFARWKCIYGQSDEQVAEAVRRDRIDILIDLSGHTAHNRLLVFARRPAPVQVSWIGYPNTTGLDCMDYRLTDAYCDPEGAADALHTERLWRLPHSFLCYVPPKSAPEPADLPMDRNGFVTFGSMNSRIKTGDESIELWAQVLRAVPGSRLLLKFALGLDDEAVVDAMLAKFERLGIERSRIEMRPSAPGVAEHLVAYHDVDIALDTFPYHGTTTTCEALWMGVPVVSLVGDRHGSRVGLSLLSNAGLPDCVAEDAAAFVGIATALASDADTLRGLRAGLRDHLRHSTLLDQRAMGERLGTVLREMWRACCAAMAGNAEANVTLSAAEDAEPLLHLHIGGKQVKEGWKILDIEPRPEVDFVGDFRHLDSWPDECCAEIYCSHVLEHVSQTEIIGVLKNLNRMLAPGGTLYVAVPDLDVLTWSFQNPTFDVATKFEVMRTMFGGATSPYDQHMIGLNFDFMVDYLKETGFTDVEHVESFGLFTDSSDVRIGGALASLNLVVTK